MGYKPGVAFGASAALLICSALLLILFAVCGGLSCAGNYYAFASPLWTGLVTLGTSFVGLYMSKTKSEKACGAFFLALSLVGIFITLTCMTLTLTAGLAGLITESSVSYSRPSYGSVTTTTTTVPPTSSTLDASTSFIFWMCMMALGFILLILTCITSWQFCCCGTTTQSEPSTVYVYQQQPGVNLNQQTIVIPHVVQGASPGVNQFTPQPHTPAAQPAIVTQPYPPNVGGVQPPPPYSGPAFAAATPQGVAPSYPQGSPQILQVPTATPSAPPISTSRAPSSVQHPEAPKSTLTGSSPQTQRVPRQAPSAPVAAKRYERQVPLYQPLIATNQKTSPQDQHSPPNPRGKHTADTQSSELQITYEGHTAGAARQVELDTNKDSQDTGYEVPTPNTDSVALDYEVPGDPPQYDYVDTARLNQSRIAPRNDSDYVNDKLKGRPKAPDPSKK